MSAQKSSPELNHTRLNQQVTCLIIFCWKLQAKESSRCSADLTAQEKCSISGFLFKIRPRWNKIFFILYSNLLFWSSEEKLNIYKVPVPNFRRNLFSFLDSLFENQWLASLVQVQRWQRLQSRDQHFPSPTSLVPEKSSIPSVEHIPSPPWWPMF